MIVDRNRGKSYLSFTIGVIGIALILFLYLSITWRDFAGVTKAISAFKEIFSDFVIYYFPMGEAIFCTELPVSGFLYSPFIAILMAVFPPMGFATSLVLWGFLQALFVILYLLLFRWLVPAGLKIQLAFVALVLFSYPLILNLLGGQVSVFMIVALLGSLVFIEHGNRAAGAGLLAFAASFKFYPILFFAPFAARRDRRFLLFATAACGAVFVVVPGVIMGFGDMLGFYSALLDSFRESAWVTVNPHSQYLPHLVLRLVEAMGYDMQAHIPLMALISYGIAAANMGLIFLVQQARLPYSNLWSFQIVFLTIPFVLKTSWPHDFVFLPFTQALLVWWLLEREKVDTKNDTKEKHSHVRSTLTLVFLLLSIVFSNIVFFNLFGSFTVYGFIGFLFWANLLLLIILYMQLLPPALRKIQIPSEA
jgi:hypothetical protein